MQNKIQKSIAIIGHDGRQQAAGVYLQSKGFTVYTADEVHLADYILLPMPLSSDKVSLAQILKAAKPGAISFAGKVSTEAKTVAAAAQIELIDYLEREELAVYNAIPTAEGALGILLQERKCTVWHSSICITGYGRIAKLLSRILLDMGAAVTIVARKPADRALAKALNCNAISFEQLNQLAPKFDVVINTVPKMVIDKQILSLLKKEALILDLASAPGGVDFTEAESLGLRAIWALSLPAKCAPITAGEFVAKTVLEILRERGQY